MSSGTKTASPSSTGPNDTGLPDPAGAISPVSPSAPRRSGRADSAAWRQFGVLLQGERECRRWWSYGKRTRTHDPLTGKIHSRCPSWSLTCGCSLRRSAEIRQGPGSLVSDMGVSQTRPAPLHARRVRDAAHALLRISVGLGPWLPSPPEGEVCQWCDPGGTGYKSRGPYPLRAPDLACWPTLEVDDHCHLEAGFGNSCDDDQSAAALAEIAPPSLSSHDILHAHGRDR